MSTNKAEEYFEALLECDEKSINKGVELFNKLENIYNDKPSVDVTVFMAKSLFNLSYYSAYVHDYKRALEFQSQLDALAKKHPHNKVIVWNLVHCYANHIRDLSETNFSKAMKLFEILKEWHKNYPDNKDIAD